jgi:aldehyde:ferredoxin oxidoreductase
MITKDNLNGTELTWGNQQACLEMLGRICERNGNSFDYLLGEGIDLASRKFGRGSEKFAYHIKGGRLEIDPRTGWATALAHATSTRGADHLKGMPLSNAFGVWKKIPYEFTDDSKTDHKAEAVIFFEHLNAVIDSIGLCKNDTWSQSAECPGLVEFAEMLSALTGKDYTPDSLLRIGERIYNVERAFNSRCGLNRSHDSFQEKFYTERIETKMGVLDRETFEKLKTEYYELRKWDPSTGHPTEKKLRELGLDAVADDLKARKVIA